MDGNSTDRLFTDSIRVSERRKLESRFSRAVNEENEWMKRLSASNLLSIPSVKPPLRPFTSQSTMHSDPKSNSAHESHGSCLDIRFTPGSRFTSVPGKALPLRKTGGGFVKPSVPRQVTFRRESRSQGNSRLAEVSAGIQGYALPTLHLTGKEHLVACRSAITAFYDAQGTY